MARNVTDRAFDPPPPLTARQERLRVLAAELRQLEQEELDEIKRKKDAVRRVWQFMLLPTAETYNKPRLLSGVTIYMLRGVVMNREECLKAGQTEHELGGGMSYYYNLDRGRFVCHTGGGTMYIRHDYSTPAERAEAEITFEKLEEFLYEHPEGGDVTAIITTQKSFHR